MCDFLYKTRSCVHDLRICAIKTQFHGFLSSDVPPDSIKVNYGEIVSVSVSIVIFISLAIIF